MKIAAGGNQGNRTRNCQVLSNIYRVGVGREEALECIIYTGLTNFEVLHAVFDFVVPPAIVKRVCVDNYQIEARSSI